MKPLREHFEIETDAGTTLRTFDYIDALEKYVSELNGEIRTIRAQWIGMKEECDSLMMQIEYMNKEAVKFHDRMMQLEFEKSNPNPQT
jgi:hypothetical protein